MQSTMPSRPALGALPRTGAGAARERGRRPLAHVAGLRPACGRDARAPRDGARMQSTMPSRPALGALPRTGAGAARERGRRPLAHVAGLRPARRRQERHARATHTPAQGVVMGVMVSSRKRGPPGSAGILPATGRRPAKRRQKRHTRAGYSPARGVVKGVVKGLVMGVMVSSRKRGPPGSAGILPATGRRPAKRRQKRHARAGYSPVRGVVMGVMVSSRKRGPPGSAGILPATGRRPAKRRQERHTRAGYSPVRGAQCRRDRPWVHCRGLALEQPGSVGVARLPMWRACGPLAGETPALPGTAPVCRAQCRRDRPWVHCRGLALEQPGSVGVARLPMWRACGPLAGETPALPGTTPVCRAQCRRDQPWVHCRGLALE